MENYIGYRFLLLFLITAMNAFFASAEVALLSVRPSRLRELAQRGNVGAHAALSLLGNTERLLSVVQIGVTLASLGMGWAGEDTVYRLLLGLFQPVTTPATHLLIHAVSFVIAFLVLTLALVVIGEVVPKNAAIEKAEPLAVLMSPGLLVFARIAAPFVFVTERSAALVTRLLGFKGSRHAAAHTPEELKLIVRSSRSDGLLSQFEESAIQKLLDLENYSVREIMVPRNNVVMLPVEATLDEALRVFEEHKFSRIPVYEGAPENILGLVNSKDLLRVWQERRSSNERRRPVPPFQLRRLLRKPLVAPETKSLNQMIDSFRENHAHMALVVNEFGTIVGLVTLEDVLEQVFGEIEDEYDVKEPLPALEAAEIETEGTVSIRDLATQYGIVLPAEAGFETLAGFLLFRLGHIPTAGEAVDWEDRRYTILEMERNRIARVLIQRV